MSFPFHAKVEARSWTQCDGILVLAATVDRAARLRIGGDDERLRIPSDFAKEYVAQGRVEEAARALLTVLRWRGIALSEEERAQILNQNDPSVLERWHERAIDASSVAEVFQIAR